MTQRLLDGFDPTMTPDYALHKASDSETTSAMRDELYRVGHLAAPLAEATIEGWLPGWSAVEYVARLRELRDQVEVALAAAVASARTDDRETWDDIAAALDVTRQSAWERYRR